MRTALWTGVWLLAAPLSFGQVQEAKLVASDAAAGDSFGYAVAMDGSTAIVGTLNADAAYVYTRSGTVWTEQAILVGGDTAAGDDFGYSVGISGDTAIVGARAQNGGTGAAYVFTRSGTVWSQQQKLTAADGAAADEFGFSVALDADTAIVGARFDDDNGSGSGSAYAYFRTGTTWAQQQKLTAADGAMDDEFGFSVALDGDTAIVGAYQDDDVAGNSGSAYAFVRSGSVWSQQDKFTAGDAATNDWFGYSVAVSGDTAFVGAILDDDLGVSSGSIYVFDRSGTVWSAGGKLNASDGAGSDLFGVSVGMDGNSAVVGANMPAGNGAAYTFARVAGVWNETAKLTALDGAAGDQFGFSVDVSGDRAIVGARLDDDAGADSGSAYVFGAPLGTLSCFGVGCPCANDDPTAGCANSTGVGGTLAASGSTSVSAGDFALLATDLPRLNNGLFYMGDVVVMNQLYDGFQCALGNTFRFLGSIQNTGDQGTMSYASFVSDAPLLITAGTTWHFHAWHRDFPNTPCGTQANFTALYSVTFRP